MKLNLECGQNVILGYRNIDSKPQSNNVERGNFKDLTSLRIPDGSVEEIRTGSALRKVHMTEIPALMDHWKSKLQVGGTLYIGGTDGDVITTMMSFTQIGLDDFNKIIFGETKEDTAIGIYSLSTMGIFLKRLNFEIVNQGIAGTNFFITAKKVA